MSTSSGLAELLKAVNTYKGSWQNAQLAIDVAFALFERYDPDMQFMYPSKNSKWDDLLQKTIDDNGYNKLTKDQTLSILFGLHHRSRVVDGLWFAMFREGVTRQLLERLQALEAE